MVSRILDGEEPPATAMHMKVSCVGDPERERRAEAKGGEVGCAQGQGQAGAGRGLEQCNCSVLDAAADAGVDGRRSVGSLVCGM